MKEERAFPGPKKSVDMEYFQGISHNSATKVEDTLTSYSIETVMVPKNI